MIKKINVIVQVLVVSLFISISLYAQDSVDEHLNKGREYQINKMYDEAIVEFKKAIQNCAEAYDRLGWLYMDKGEMEEGVAYLQKNSEINPDYAPTYVSLALIMYNDGKRNIEKTREYLLRAKELYKKQGDYIGEEEVDEFLNKLF